MDPEVKSESTPLVIPGDLDGVLSMAGIEPHTAKARTEAQSVDCNHPQADALPSEENFGHNEADNSPPQQTCSQHDTPVEATSAWTFFLDSAQEYDRIKIEKWKGELDNLLVFAGLLSAVVTAYTIESYSWLQADPADTTNTILLQISAQLASFSQSPGFTNSTVPQISQNITSAIFRPESIDVTINTLWFLSLTLSLLTAFFAIAAQQWLRVLPLPQHLPVLDSVRLWNRRTEDLILWQMPKIITLLPVALQLSVVLFLVGLYHLLRSLNHPITIAYTVVVGIPFCLYAISVPLPLIWPHCPYKSPLLPSTVFLLQWCMLILLTLATFAILIPAFIVQVLVTFSISYVFKESEADPNLSLVGAERNLYWLANTVGNLVGVVLDSDRDFWLQREATRLVKKQDAHSKFSDQSSALSRAPTTIARHELDRLMPCLLSLPSIQRTRVVINWVALYFGSSDVELLLYDGRSPISLDILKLVDRPFAAEYTRFLLASLPTDWQTRDEVFNDEDTTCLLIVLTWVYKAEVSQSELKRSWIPLLIDVCEGQQLSVIIKSDDYGNVRYPTICLFDSASQGLRMFTTHECERLIALTLKRIPELLEINERLHHDYLRHTVDMILGSVAISLGTMTDQDSQFFAAHDVTIRQLLTEFARFLTAQERGIQYMAKLALDQPGQPLMITRSAMKAAVDALLVLAHKHQLPPDALAPLVDTLVRTCNGQRAFEDVSAVLDSLARAAAVTRPASKTAHAMTTPCALHGTPGELTLESIAALPLLESPASARPPYKSEHSPLGDIDAPLCHGPRPLTSGI